ncbi:MAG: peroxidase [Planctomycetota bacterium]|nr:MAG: peroxidase [Planctomycetota bacterium]
MADHLESQGWREAPLSEAEKAFCAYADKLTRQPESMSSADVEALRAAGWSDRQIHDGCQVIAYFNYINRIADGLGVDPETWLPPN